MKGKKSKKAWCFPLAVVLLYIMLAASGSGAVMEALSFSGGIALTIAPVFVLVFVLMAGTNYLVTPAAVKSISERIPEQRNGQ